MEELNSAVHTLVVKIEQIHDSEGVPCTKAEAHAIVAQMIRSLVLNHPLRTEYAQDLLDTARYAVR